MSSAAISPLAKSNATGVDLSAQACTIDTQVGGLGIFLISDMARLGNSLLRLHLLDVHPKKDNHLALTLMQVWVDNFSLGTCRSLAGIARHWPVLNTAVDRASHWE